MFHRPNKTAGAKRGLIETSAYDALLPYVAGRNEPPRYALHFGTVDKVGVNPRSQWATPLAVCAFPLTKEIFDQFLKITLPFAQKEARYLYLLEIRPEARVFYSTPRFFNRGVGPEYVWGDDESREFFYSTRPEDYESAPQYVSEEHRTVAKAAQWGRKLMDMGIGVWVDADNEGILHENEPSQVMFFDPLSYSVVLSIDNPKTSIETRYGRDWRRRAKRGDLIKADLTGASLYRVNLTGVNLTGVNLTGALLTRAVLTEAVLIGARMFRAVLTEAVLIKVNLYGANLFGALLTRVNLTRANLRDADLRGANLTEAVLTEAVLISARMFDANLTGANLTGADLRGANLTGAYLTGVHLKDVKYDDSTVWPNSVSDVLRVWQGDKDLYDVNLRGANLTGADLTGADLRYAAVNGAWLRYAILTGADLSDADLTDAILEGITYDETTKWPIGFTPPPSTPRPNRR
jgi:uncharacterized protein YjbI with pentapeptide repeats